MRRKFKVLMDKKNDVCAKCLEAHETSALCCIEHNIKMQDFNDHIFFS